MAYHELIPVKQAVHICRQNTREGLDHPHNDSRISKIDWLVVGRVDSLRIAIRQVNLGTSRTVFYWSYLVFNDGGQRSGGQYLSYEDALSNGIEAAEQWDGELETELQSMLGRS
jgi:hypothetical protein